MSTKPVRAAPRRTIRKEEAIRHLIHAAIRSFAAAEDPFAISMLIHSADKILIDMSRKMGKPLMFRWDEFAKPEHVKTIFTILRETYNFLKHAAKDHDKELSVYDITYFNALTLGICTVNFNAFFGYWTDHMRLFHSFVSIAMPNGFVPSANGAKFDSNVDVLRAMTPAEYFSDLWTDRSRAALPNLLTERAEDLSDSAQFFNTKISQLQK